MKDVVSRYGTSLVGWTASVWIVTTLFVSQGFPWTVLAAASLTLAAAALPAKERSALRLK